MINNKSFWVDFTLLKENRNFRMVFMARFVSVLALGMMTVAVPIRAHLLTGSTLQVGVIMALDGIGMFVGLMFGACWRIDMTADVDPVRPRYMWPWICGVSRQ
ncbi:hypothetical protein P4S72_09960 [Vibrio sp. PP-XX7]